MNDVSTAWIYLVAAGFLEVGWPVGLKLAQTPGKVAIGSMLAALCLFLSGWLLFQAQKHIPIGTAYAVWTGLGGSGTFVLGILVYGDSAQPLRVLACLLIISGIMLLKFTS